MTLDRGTVIAATPRGWDAAIALRPIVPDDRSFLLAVYASTREPELAAVEWDAAQKAAFVEMQFDAQHAYYQEHYAGAAFDVILVFGQPAGRLYVAREADEIRMFDSYQLPVTSPQSQTGLVTDNWLLETGNWQSTSHSCPTTATVASGRRCCAGCSQKPRLPASPTFALRATAGKLLRIHVERFNPALRLYERLASHPIADRGVYLFMEWRQGGRR